MENKTIKSYLLKANWKMWEYILIFTGWIFGYNNSTYHGVKNNRNSAYFKYKFQSRGVKK